MPRERFEAKEPVKDTYHQCVFPTPPQGRKSRMKSTGWEQRLSASFWSQYKRVAQSYDLLASLFHDTAVLHAARAQCLFTNEILPMHIII